MRAASRARAVHAGGSSLGDPAPTPASPASRRSRRWQPVSGPRPLLRRTSLPEPRRTHLRRVRASPKIPRRVRLPRRPPGRAGRPTTRPAPAGMPSPTRTGPTARSRRRARRGRARRQPVWPRAATPPRPYASHAEVADILDRLTYAGEPVRHQVGDRSRRQLNLPWPRSRCEGRPSPHRPADAPSGATHASNTPPPGPLTGR